MIRNGNEDGTNFDYLNVSNGAKFTGCEDMGSQALSKMAWGITRTSLRRRSFVLFSITEMSPVVSMVRKIRNNDKPSYRTNK